MKNGFTLIELLVVISIIGILSIELLVFGALNKASNEAEKKENLNCEQYKDRTVDKVPVKCFEFYGIDSVEK